MSNPSSTVPGMEFAQDMRTIREQAGVAIEAIHEETKIPIGLIETFEETALFDHPQFNVVYLRSFVRSYAEMVGIDPDEVIEALEAAQAGRYGRELAIKHLGMKPPSAPAQRPVAAAKPTPEARPAKAPPAPPVPAAPRPTPAAEVTRTEDSAEAGRSVEWSETKTWVVVIGGAVIAAVLIFLALQGGSGESDEPLPAEPATAVAADAPEPEPAAPEPVVLDPVFDVRILAETAPVQGIRVRVDDDLRRPYWIERDSSLRFDVAERIVLESQSGNQLAKIRLFVADYEYPVRERARDQRLVLTRTSAQAYLDSLIAGSIPQP